MKQELDLELCLWMSYRREPGTGRHSWKTNPNVVEMLKYQVRVDLKEDLVLAPHYNEEIKALTS